MWNLAEKLLGLIHLDRLCFNPIHKGIGQERLTRVYAPLRKLLLDTHITSCSSVMYPTFRMRLKRAFPFLKRATIGQFIQTLSDKGMHKSGPEVEYGQYPLDEIERVIKDNLAYCDGKLVDLLQAALRCRMEIYPEETNELNWADEALIKRIFNEYEKLTRGS